MEKELFAEFSLRLAVAVEGMTMEKPECSWDPIPSPPQGDLLRWRQRFGDLPGAVWVLASEPDWTNVGKAVLVSAGIEQADAAEYRSTFLEINSQALAGLGQALTKKLEREVLPVEGAEAASSQASAKWSEVHVQLGAVSFTLMFGIEDALLAGLVQSRAVEQPKAMAATAGAAQAVSQSKTFDLLLDVELPVSVSFGRAQIPIKDVLKLNTGSIVELNRAVVEPVEIIVNNCVIARGEVVVLDGNFGVRIQAVISRQERLRTLQ